MSRRALRKIDPTLDLSRHLRTLDALGSPWDGAKLFGRDAPLEVEVGSGKGLFLQTAAAGTPEILCIGTSHQIVAELVEHRTIVSQLLNPG